MVTQDPSWKLVSRKDGSFSVLQIRNHTVTVDVNGIDNVLSIDRIMLAKTAEEALQATKTKRCEDVPFEADNIGDEYVVKRTVRHKDDVGETKYFVRWYGYEHGDDTWEPSHHSPQHFIRHYWKRQRCAKQRRPWVSV